MTERILDSRPTNLNDSSKSEWINEVQTVPEQLNQSRLDKTAAVLFVPYSRMQITRWIVEGRLSCNGITRVKPSSSVFAGECLHLSAPQPDQGNWLAEPDLPLSVVYEDEDLFVINKSAGTVVHPGAGNTSQTLANALLGYDPKLARLARAGIVHRLDKDTTGLLVVARTELARTYLIDALQNRTVKRQYVAWVKGIAPEKGKIQLPIGRDPHCRTKMKAWAGGEKPACTYFEKVQTYHDLYSRLELVLGSGRTHQIRVHCAALGFPLLGDLSYGKALDLQGDYRFDRQALHAHTLSFLHPRSLKSLRFHAPLPADLEDLDQRLKSLFSP